MIYIVAISSSTVQQIDCILQYDAETRELNILYEQEMAARAAF